MNAHECAYEFFDPQEDEDVPVTYRQSSFTRAFGLIPELYGTPHYFSKIDTGLVLAAFYLFFFAYMLSDAGYGILLIIIGIFMFKKLKPREGPIKNLLTMVVLFGIVTIFIGAMFSSWFGDLPNVLGRAIGGGEAGDLGWSIPPLIFDPMQNTLVFLGIAMGLGVIHLFVGVSIGAWRMVLDGDAFGGFVKSIPWFAVIAGFGLMALGYQIGTYVVIVCLVFLVLFSDRDKNKGIGARIGSGVWSVYSGITGWLGDILSYARLMALGLATGVVATVINLIASFFADNFVGWGVVGWIIFIVVLVFGHAFNFALGLLGAFIHTTRLMFVEFYTKCYVSGGRAFKPLSNQTKFMQVIKEEN
jgi:V/A-type H+-transporting ATPase subunit I